MAYPVKFSKMRQRGFTLVELLIVIAIVAIITSMSSATYSSFNARAYLEIATNGVVEAIRHAQIKAQTGKDDSAWGVKVFPNSIIIFRGESYDQRDITADQRLNFPQEIQASGLSEIAFKKIIGITANTGTVILTGSRETKNISINAKGTIFY